MISPNNQTYILKLVERLLPTILEEVDFDPTVKEVGHSFGEKVEETLVNKLCDLDPAFTAPEGKREMQDVSFNDDLINIKFGFDKKGQPNMVAFNRLSERYLKGEIDSYYIISIDGKTNKVTFFDLYQHLPYTNYNVVYGLIMAEWDFTSIAFPHMHLTCYMLLIGFTFPHCFSNIFSDLPNPFV